MNSTPWEEENLQNNECMKELGEKKINVPFFGLRNNNLKEKN